MEADDIKLGEFAADTAVGSATVMLMVRDAKGIVFTLYARPVGLSRDAMLSAIDSLWRTVEHSTAELP